ncbi:hypothetical protein [Methanoculleus oceani]|uniref:hypothetical protein n=1 Tax=Methanoculleus oceani TaxID=2184756 RepID=UPI0020341944|nr:hypothetical protein [Methanoculleus sp. CWC-02]
MTIHGDVFEAAKYLAARSVDGSFRPKEVKSLLVATGKEHNRRSVQGEIQRGCTNGSKCWGTVYARYERIKRGVYKLFEPGKKN